MSRYTTVPDVGDVRAADTSCTYGLLLQCERNEECVPMNSRSHTGHCHCKDGFSRNAHTSWCDLDKGMQSNQAFNNMYKMVDL